MQFATYYLTAVAELIYFEQYCGQLFARSPLCQWQWLLVVALVVFRAAARLTRGRARQARRARVGGIARRVATPGIGAAPDIALVLALIATASAGAIEQKNAVAYTYEDIREQELKCKADRNREWKYDAATNTWACPLQRYD